MGGGLPELNRHPFSSLCFTRLGLATDGRRSSSGKPPPVPFPLSPSLSLDLVVFSSVLCQLGIRVRVRVLLGLGLTRFIFRSPDLDLKALEDLALIPLWRSRRSSRVRSSGFSIL